MACRLSHLLCLKDINEIENVESLSNDYIIELEELINTSDAFSSFLSTLLGFRIQRRISLSQPDFHIRQNISSSLPDWDIL